MSEGESFRAIHSLTTSERQTREADCSFHQNLVDIPLGRQLLVVTNNQAVNHCSQGFLDPETLLKLEAPPLCIPILLLTRYQWPRGRFPSFEKI